MTSPSSLDDNNKNKKKKVPLHAIRILPYDETCPTKYKNARWWSIFAFVIAILGQWANCLLLPSIYNRLTDSLGFDASQLGLLHAMRLFSMFGSLPLHAYLSQFYHRGRLMSLSLIVGGFVTMLNVIGLTFTTFMILNMLAGCSLGMVVPVTRSLIPNYYRLEDRGSAFGILEVAGGLGGFVGAGMGVIITRYTQPFGQVREIYDLALLNTNPNDFKILMSHDPSHWEEKVKKDPFNYQLTLSGHTHGLQMGIEIPGWFKWSPSKYAYKQWAGLYKEADRVINVNRGFGYHAFPGRVGIWPEITVIELKKS